MRVDTDDFGRPCRCGKEHHIEVEEILIEAGAVEKLEEAMSDGFLKKYISPLLICDTNTMKATEELMEDIYDRCQVLTLDAVSYTHLEEEQWIRRLCKREAACTERSSDKWEAITDQRFL